MVDMIKVSELKPHPLNDYFFDDIEGDKWEEFLDSVQRQGVMTPLVITPDKTIVSGHQRYRACLALHIEEVPCRVMPALNDDDAIILAIINSNIRQRGIINSPSIKLGHIMLELERITGAGTGDDGGRVRKGQVSRASIRKYLGVEAKVATCSKTIAQMPGEIQTLIESESITPRTAYDIVAKLPREDQIELAKKLDPGQYYSQTEIRKAIAETFPDEEQIDEMQQRLAEYQQNDGELELREKLRESQAKERQAYEDLQAERRLRKKERMEHEKHQEAMEKLLDEANPDASAEIARLREERDQYMQDADAAQSDADLQLVIGLINSLSGSFSEAANDPRPLDGSLAEQALDAIDKLRGQLDRIEARIKRV